MAITTAQILATGSAQKMATAVHRVIGLKIQIISLLKNCFSIDHSVAHSGQIYHLTSEQ